MKINENDIRMMNRMMAAEMLLKEAMVGTEGAESNSIPEQVTLYSLIHEMSGLLRDSTVIMKEIGDLVKKYEDNDWEDAFTADRTAPRDPPTVSKDWDGSFFNYPRRFDAHRVRLHHLYYCAAHLELHGHLDCDGSLSGSDHCRDWSNRGCITDGQ